MGGGVDAAAAEACQRTAAKLKATIREGAKAPSQIKCASSGFQDDAEGLYCQEQINRSGHPNMTKKRIIIIIIQLG